MGLDVLILSFLSSASGEEVISCIRQSNTDGDRKIYEPLNKLSLDENSPWYGVKYILCAYHMIDKWVKSKIYVNDKNNAFVKRWVKTWCNSLETEEEYKHSYNQFLAFIDSDLEKEGLGHAHAHILEGYLVESFHQKEHHMVKYVRMETGSFEGNTSVQAEHENRAMKSSGWTNPMFALVRSLDAMLIKTQQRYLMKLCEAGKDIVSVPLWIKRKGAKDLTKLGEGLMFMDWSERDQHFVMRLSEMVYLVVRMGMVFPSERFPGIRPRYIHLRVVKFDIDDTVTCSCKYHKRVGIRYHHIKAIVGDVLCSMIDVRWRKSL
jgi:hypothetical protein